MNVVWYKTIPDTFEKSDLVQDGYVSYIEGNGCVYYFSALKHKVRRYIGKEYVETRALSKPTGTEKEVIGILERWFAIDAQKQKK